MIDLELLLYAMYEGDNSLRLFTICKYFEEMNRKQEFIDWLRQNTLDVCKKVGEDGIAEWDRILAKVEAEQHKIQERVLAHKNKRAK